MVPPTNRPDTFPRESLLGDERVIFETRPKMARWQWVCIVWGAFMYLLWGAVALSLPVVGATAIRIIALVIVVLLAGTLFGFPIWIALWVWRRRAYAMTNQRVIAQVGENTESLSWTLVGEVRFEPKRSKVKFLSVPAPPGSVAPALESQRVPQIVWLRTPGGAAVAAFGTSAQFYYGLKNRQYELRQRMVIGAEADRIICEYCKNPMRIDELDPASPKCPRCGAPITVAGGGP
jgi:hypothetical protein